MPSTWRSLTILALLVGLPCRADDESILKQISKNLPEITTAATSLASLAPTVRNTAFAIALLGLIVSAIATVKKGWVQWVGVGTGLLISILTLVNTIFFVLDYKTLRFLAQDALDTVKVIEDSTSNYFSALKIPSSAARKRETEKYLRDIAEGQSVLLRLDKQAREGGHSLGVNRSIAFVRPLSSADPLVFNAPGSWFGLPQVHAADKTPDWVQRPPYDKYRTGYVGIAACSTPYGAREMARYQAMENAARRIQTKDLDLDATMLYVERNAQQAGNYFFYEKYSGMYWHHALVLLDNAKTTASAIAKWQVPVTDVRPRWKASSKGSKTGVVTVGDESASSRQTNEGRFRFTFYRGKTLELQRVDVFADSSGRSTRWVFKVFFNGKLAIHIPLHRYEDSGKPTACLVRPQDGRTATIDAADKFEIRVEGYKPKDYE